MEGYQKHNVRCYKCFKKKYLKRILRIYWHNNNSNKELHKRTGMQTIALLVKRCRWGWIGHVRRMPLTFIPRVTMRWPPGDESREETREDIARTIAVWAKWRSSQRTEDIGSLWLRPYVWSHTKRIRSAMLPSRQPYPEYGRDAAWFSSRICNIKLNKDTILSDNPIFYNTIKN